MIRTSKGAWREAKAADLLAAAEETIDAVGRRRARLRGARRRHRRRGAARCAASTTRSPTRCDEPHRVAALNDEADDGESGHRRCRSPGLGVVLAAGILARFGDLDRFANLAGVRSFTGLVPKIDQSGLTHGHQRGDQGRRPRPAGGALPGRRLPARSTPQLAARYHRLVVDDGQAPRLGGVPRLPPCWSPASPPAGVAASATCCATSTAHEITEAEGRAIVAERYKISADVRQARRRASKAKKLKKRRAGAERSRPRPLRRRVDHRRR